VDRLFTVRQRPPLLAAIERSAERLVEEGRLTEADAGWLRELGALPGGVEGVEARQPSLPAPDAQATLALPPAPHPPDPADATLQADNDDDYGIYARGTTTGALVEAVAPAVALIGYNSSASGTSAGVIGTNTSSCCREVGVGGSGPGGVRGETNGGGASGVKGYATGTAAMNWGVVGVSESTAGIGVYGVATNTFSTVYGVRASGSASGYDFYADGAGTNYGPFTGAHEVRLAGDLETLRPGMLVSLTGHAELAGDGGTESLSATLPTVSLTRRERDPAVLGVFLAEIQLPAEHWLGDHTGRFATVNALGEGRAWVLDINGPVVAGDLLTSSPVPGYAERQSDSLIRNHTVAKALESVDWESVTDTIEYEGRRYRAALVAVIHLAG
jgi:hypothetical protein